MLWAYKIHKKIINNYRNMQDIFTFPVEYTKAEQYLNKETLDFRVWPSESAVLRGVSPGVRVLVTYLGCYRRAVAGVNSMTAHGVHWVPHHGCHSRAGREPPVG